MFERKIRKMILFFWLAVLPGGMQITAPPPKLDCEPQACLEALKTSDPDTRGTKLFFIQIEGRALVVQFATLSTTVNGDTWTGTVQETGERVVLMRWKNGRLTGMLAYKGRIYSLASSNNEIRATVEIDPEARHNALSSHGQGGGASDARFVARLQESAGAALRPVPIVAPFDEAKRRALEAKKVTIDVMVAYTQKAASRYVALPNLIAQAVEQVNESFRNSGLGNINLRLVHAQPIDYDEANSSHFDHLYRMVDGVGSFKALQKLRDEKKADIVGMIVDDPSGCGLSTRVAASSEEAYFVVHHSCAALTISLAHEIGHILGARHDRHSDSGDEPFPYGHGYANGNKWRDIMSYQESCNGCPRIPYWSNPRVMYRGEPMGTEANDNARVILEQAERVSLFR